MGNINNTGRNASEKNTRALKEINTTCLFGIVLVN